MNQFPDHFAQEPGQSIPSEGPKRAELMALSELLLGEHSGLQHLPRMADMAAAAAALARGTRRKALLPLVHRPAEMAWLRRGDDVLISYYETGSSPDIVLLDRPIPMDALLRQCTKAALEFAEATSDPTARQINRRLAERALRSNIDSGYQIPEDYVRRSGGEEEAPESAPGLAFGFEADILPGSSSPNVGSSQADIHATHTVHTSTLKMRPRTYGGNTSYGSRRRRRANFGGQRERYSRVPPK